jgi:FkbM family methyltransferase
MHSINPQGPYLHGPSDASRDRLHVSPLRRIAHAALARLPSGLVLPILGGPLCGTRWLIRSGNYSCWLGTYERVKQAAFAAELRPGMVVFDIGAHVGFYSLLAAVLTRPGGKVCAFEPLEVNAVKLRRHVAINHASVEVIEAAVADWDGQTRFQPGPDSYTGRLDDVGQLVSVVSVDALCEAGRLSHPNVVKIDVEGAEALVLRGAEQTIRRSCPVIFLAVHGVRARDDCLSLLRGLDYRVEPLVGSGIEPQTEFVARPASARGSS